MAQDAKQVPETSVRHDSEAPKSGLRMIKTQPGLGARGVPRPASAPPSVPPPSAVVPSSPPAPASRPGRAAVKQRSVPPNASPEAKLHSARLPSSPALSLPKRALPPPARSAAQVIAPPPSVPSLRVPSAAPARHELAPPASSPAPASDRSAPHALRDGLPPSPSSSHNFRSLTTTAQDWPIAPVALPVQSRGPTFGHRPPGVVDAERFSLPAFLPPVGMQVALHAANDDGIDGEYAALDAAFSLRPTPAPAEASPRLPTWLVFAAGIALGVVATLLVH
jgi:hypothetical protein